MSVVKHTPEPYWTHGLDWGAQFPTEEAAREDEARQRSRPWRIARIVGSYYEHQRAPAIEALDDTKAPYTGQPDGVSSVYLLKDLCARMSELIAEHGESVGYTLHHCGMGQYVSELVLIEPNPHYTP